MKKNVFYVPLIVILLILFVPAAIYGLYKHKFPSNQIEPTESDNVLIFKSINGETLGKYKCITDNCSFASVSIANNETKTLGIINDTYAFINDDSLFIYNFINSEKIMELTSIVSYSDVSNYLISINKDNKYGVLSVNDMKYIIDSKYNSISTKNIDNLNPIFYINDNNEYYLMDVNNTILTNKYNSEIVNYNDSYLIIKNNDMFDVVDYNNNLLNTNDYFKNADICNNLIIGQSDSSIYIYENGAIIRDYYEYSDLLYQIEDNRIIIKSLDEEIEQIEC